MYQLNITQLNRSLILLLLFALIIFTASVSTENLGSLKNCLECHEDIWVDETNKNFIHEPFLEKDCIVCHSENASLLFDDEAWTDTSPLASTSHWFEFDACEPPPTIILQASFSNMVCLTREIPFPPLDDLSELSDVYEQSPPKITDVEVLEVKKGIFLTATIYWQTDRPTGSTIIFGVKKLRQTTPGDRQLRTEHLETLSDLKFGQTYQFRITAEDTVGNRTESDIFEFGTFSTFSNPTLKSVAENCSLTKALSLKSNIFRKDDQYLLNITGTQPFKIFLRLKNNDNIKTETLNEPIEDVFYNHIILAEEEISTFLACKKCHNDSEHHPVNVYPKRGMQVLSDYSTMADGRISCISCHAPHASNLQFLLVKDKRQGLCSDCHASQNNKLQT